MWVLLNTLIAFTSFFSCYKLSSNESNFVALRNQDLSTVDPNSVYISFTTKFTKYECFSVCNQDQKCVLLYFKSNKCKLFKFIPTRYLVSSSSNYLYKKLNSRYL